MPQNISITKRKTFHFFNAYETQAFEYFIKYSLFSLIIVYFYNSKVKSQIWKVLIKNELDRVENKSAGVNF